MTTYQPSFLNVCADLRAELHLQTNVVSATQGWPVPRPVLSRRHQVAAVEI